MLRKFLRFIFRKRTSSKWDQPTSAQLAYLEGLIQINNTFRANPLILKDWIKTHYAGTLYRWSATKLIKRIKAENDEKNKSFKKKMKNKFDRQEKVKIYASDFSAYGFCPNSFYLSYRGFASRNLYELESGKVYHGERGTLEGYKNKNSEFLINNVEGIQTVEWFKASEEETLHDLESSISGVPDGIIIFKDKTQAIVELKSTKSSAPTEPYLGDVMQACAYLRLYQKNPKYGSYAMSPNVFILYTIRDTGTRKLFEVNSKDYELRFVTSLKNMRKPIYSSELLNSERNKNKCPACGHRVMCQNFAAS